MKFALPRNGKKMLLRPRGCLVTLTLGCLAFTFGCVGVGPSGGPPPKMLVSVSVSPSSVPLSVGGSQQLAAIANYNDGSTTNVTTSAQWASSDAAAATVNSGGLVTAMADGSATITASYTDLSGNAAVTIGSTTKTLKSISVSPASSSILAGGTQQLTATGNYSDGTSANITGTVSWTSSSGTVATVSSGGLVSAAATGSVTITASESGQNGTAAVSVGTNVVTWHNDAWRSGLNAVEGTLNPQNVVTKTFGKLNSYHTDGYIYGEPLFVSSLTMNGVAHDVVFVATETDSVYAFDADTLTSTTPLWQVSLLAAGETPITNGAIQPYLGVTSTPAIDLTTKTLYVVATESSSTGGTFRLHALDLATGAEKFGGPVLIQAQVPGTNSDSVNGIVSLTTSCLQRAALLVANGSVYIGFGGCHSGWLVSYDAQKLTQTGVFNSSPNLNGEGTFGGAGGVWMGGGGPASDSLGNVYITTGNGPYDGKTAFGDSVLKFDSKLRLLDHFTPFDYQYMDCSDKDLAAGGLMLIPGGTEALAAGKSGKLYLVNTTELGGEQANDAGATQTLWFESDLTAPYSASCTDSLGTHTSDINSYEIFATSAFLNNTIYLGVTPTSPGIPGPLRQFSYSGTLAPGAYTSQNIMQGSYGTTPVISAAGTSDAVVWMLDHGQPLQTGTATSAILRAFDASDLTMEIYDSSQTSSDIPGYGIKFTSPVVANGKVFIVTGHDPVTATNPAGELDIYGLKN